MGERVLRRAEVRELDRRAIEEYGIPSIVLMENAGRACAFEAEALLAGAQPGPVLVLAGPGNNGGDGFVIARTLFNRGYEVGMIFAAEPEKLTGASVDLATNARLWEGLRQAVDFVTTRAQVDSITARIAGASLVVDALFGTGLTRELRDPWVHLIEVTNREAHRILAVDLPSGLDADTGEALGAVVRAHTTISFVARKPGFVLGKGPEACGRVVVAEIGIPRTLLAP